MSFVFHSLIFKLFNDGIVQTFEKIPTIEVVNSFLIRKKKKEKEKRKVGNFIKSPNSN